MEGEAPRSRVLRIGRFSEPGHYYNITTCCKDRVCVFENMHAAGFLTQALRHQVSLRRAETVCYVIMPDHLHWLLCLTGERGLSDVIKEVKRYSARRIRQEIGGRGPVWQDGFYDHRLRSDEDLFRQSRYIIENPVRAGLVESVEEYPYWDAAWLYDRDFL